MENIRFLTKLQAPLHVGASPLVDSMVIDAVYGAAMTSVKGRRAERCIARLSAGCVKMLL